MDSEPVVQMGQDNPQKIVFKLLVIVEIITVRQINYFRNIFFSISFIMVKRHDRKPDGKYHIGNQQYDMLKGSRPRVWHGTAHETPGGLKKGDLKMHNGRIVSRKKSELAKTQKHLSGHLQPKGSGCFGNVTKKGKTGTKAKRGTRKRKGTRRK